MAEGIMKECILDEVTVQDQNLPIKVISAGTHALNGYPASEYAIEAAARHGIDIRFHRSGQLSEEVVKDADLILTMERNHTNIIKQNWSDINCVYELKNFSHEKLENVACISDNFFTCKRKVYQIIKKTFYLKLITKPCGFNHRFFQSF